MARRKKRSDAGIPRGRRAVSESELVRALLGEKLIRKKRRKTRSDKGKARGSKYMIYG